MFQEIPKNCQYAYARVSSKSQEDNSSLNFQKQEFLRLGVPKKNIRVEVGSAADSIHERPIFYDLIENELKETKNLSITQVAKITGRARSTIYKILKEELNYIPYNRLVKNVNQEAVNEPK